MGDPLRALLIDDSADDTELLVRHLARSGFDVTWERVDTAAGLRSAARRQEWDIALCDFTLPSLTGPEALEILRLEAPDLPAIVVSGQVGEEYTVEVMRAGARDFVHKERLFRLVPAIRRELTEAAGRLGHRRAEAALSDSERVRRLALEVGKIGTFEIELATGRSTWSAEVTEIWGIPPGFAGDLQRFCWERCHPDDQAAVRELYAQLLREGGEVETELRVVRPDGTVRWLRWRGRLVSDAAGVAVRIVGVNVDVTDRKRLERERETALIKYRTLFDAFPLGITVADRRGKIVEANRIAERLLGIATEEHLQRHIDGEQWRIVRPDGSPMPADEFASVRALREQRLVENVEMGVVKPSGETSWINVTAAPLPIEGYGVVATYGNVSEHKRMATALRASEERFHDALDVMMEGCQIIGFDWRYGYVNAAAARQGRTTVEALLGRTMMEAYPGIETTAMFTQLRQCMEQRTAQQLENAFAFPDGSTGWFELLVHPVPEGIFILSLDVTARHEADAEIRRLNTELERRVEERTAQLQDAIEELEAFNHTVSHDLRAPLRHIEGFLRLLDDECRAELSGTARQYLDRVRAGSDRMAQMIEALLQLSRAGRAAMQCRRVDLGEMARTVFADRVKEQAERPVELTVGSIPAVVADPVLVHQLLENLLGNALKFTSRTPRPCLAVGCERRDGEDVFYVRDNGAGFDAAHARTLFGVFQRFHAAGEFEGTGIGLSIARRIVERHGGRIWAESTPGGGATFWFTLGTPRS